MFVVAGVTGRTGRVVAETLLEQGRPVRVVVRDPRRGEAWLQRGAQCAVASLDDPRALERALVGADGFFALLPEDLAAEDFHGQRRRMAETMAAAVHAKRVPHVVLLSAMVASVPDGNGPGQDLHLAENALRATRSDVTALRACYFQENVAAAIPAARDQGIYPNFLPSADVAMPTVATRDVGRLAARCLVEPPVDSELIDVFGPEYSVRQMADALGAALGKSLRVVDIPAAAHVEALLGAGLPAQFARALAEMYACFASGRISPRGGRAVRGGTELAETLAGLVPRTTREGAR